MRVGALPPWARSRWTIVPGAMVILILGWMAYVSQHDNGIIEGRVVDAAGKPVAGAAVFLLERGFVTHQEKARTTTDGVGAFRFERNPSHSIQLEATADGLGRTDRRVVRLWFAAQDVRVEAPLRFAAGALIGRTHTQPARDPMHKCLLFPISDEAAAQAARVTWGLLVVGALLKASSS